MNIREFCESFRVNEEEALLIGVEWWRSCSECPDGVPDFLTVETLRGNFSRSGLEPEVLPLLEEMAEHLKSDRKLTLFAWHTFRNLTVYSGVWSFTKWPELDTLFDGRGGLFYLLIACSIVKPVQEKYRELGLPDEYLLCCSRIRGYYDTYRAGYGQPGLNHTQLHWLRLYLDGKVFRVGRFEYKIEKGGYYNALVYRNRKTAEITALAGPQFRSFNRDGYVLYPDQTEPAFSGAYTRANGVIRGISFHPDGVALSRPVELHEAEWEEAVSAGDDVLGLHIPEGGKMTLDICGESFREAFVFFKKYFPEYNFKAVFCVSWIFYPYYEQVLPQSNLAALMRELYLFPAPSAGHDGVYFIFGRADGDFKDYPRDNSVRRAMLDVLQNGGRLRVGGMFILPEHLPLFGQSPYRKVKK